MKRLTCLPLLFLLFVSCKKNEPFVSPDGQIRLQRIKDKDGRVSTEFSYDAQRRILNQKSYWLGRTTPDEIKYSYDGQGRLEKVETSTLGLLSCYGCEGPATKFIQTFEYDANGRVVSTRNMKEDGWVASQWAYEYDLNGRLIRQNSFSPNGVKGNYNTFTYDTRGNITKTETFAANGTLTNRNTYEYDAQPNPFQSVYLGLYAALFRSPNNVVRSKSEFLSPGGSPPSEGSTRYDYDPTTGYPVRAEHENGSVSVFEY